MRKKISMKKRGIMNSNIIILIGCVSILMFSGCGGQSEDESHLFTETSTSNTDEVQPVLQDDKDILNDVIAKLNESKEAEISEADSRKYEGTYEELMEDPDAWSNYYHTFPMLPGEVLEEHISRFWDVEVKVPVADEAQFAEIDRRAKESYEVIQKYGFWTLDMSDDSYGHRAERERQVLEMAENSEYVGEVCDREFFSLLDYDLQVGTVVDCGDYYAVSAVFEKPVELPPDLKAGDSYSFVMNEITGENMTITCRETHEGEIGDIIAVGDDGLDYYYEIASDGEKAYLATNEKRTNYLEAIVYDGILRLHKDAIVGSAYAYEFRSLYPTRRILGWYYLSGWHNETVFDSDGYVTWILYNGE